MEANSLRRLIKQISLFLLIAVLLTTSCFAESMHQQIDNPNLTLDVTVGYDGLMTYGKTMAEAVEIGTTLAASVITSSENVCPRFQPAEFGLNYQED